MNSKHLQQTADILTLQGGARSLNHKAVRLVKKKNMQRRTSKPRGWKIITSFRPKYGPYQFTFTLRKLIWKKKPGGEKGQEHNYDFKHEHKIATPLREPLNETV